MAMSSKDYHKGRPEGHRQYQEGAFGNTKQVKTASKGSAGSKPNAGAGPPEKR